MAATWQNWAGTAHASPMRTVWPADIEELRAVVTGTTGRIKAIGSGHSFTPIGVTDGVLVHLDRLSGLVDVDHARCTATLLAGTTIAEANRLLAEQGLALPNLGDIDAQSVAGAIATGTHGTGARFTGLAAMVVGLDLLTADGTVRHLTEGDEFQAARVGLGALGITTAVTFRCEPSFLLRAVERPAGLDETLEGFDEWVGSHDHAEFYWFPHTRRVLTKTNDRVDGPPRPLHRARAWFDDELMSNSVFEQANRIATRAPAIIPRLNRFAARALSAREYVDTSHRVFCSPRRVVFRETEYAIPRAALEPVLTAAQAWLDRSGERVAFPVEVRVAAPDDVWLSTGHERANVYVAFHQYARRDHAPWFTAVEAVLRDHDGRPHWGKLHSLVADDFARLYPRFGDFLTVRDRLDPDRRFTNEHLDRVLGVPGH
ncbi:D-arabinono-1,4-lactone oxidase [Jatrophihabitans sp. YIM 134969]